MKHQFNIDTLTIHRRLSFWMFLGGCTFIILVLGELVNMRSEETMTPSKDCPKEGEYCPLWSHIQSNHNFTLVYKDLALSHRHLQLKAHPYYRSSPLNSTLPLRLSLSPYPSTKSSNLKWRTVNLSLNCDDQGICHPVHVINVKIRDNTLGMVVRVGVEGDGMDKGLEKIVFVSHRGREAWIVELIIVKTVVLLFSIYWLYMHCTQSKNGNIEEYSYERRVVLRQIIVQILANDPLQWMLLLWPSRWL